MIPVEIGVMGGALHLDGKFQFWKALVRKYPPSGLSG